MDYEKKYKEALERARQFSEKPYLEDSKGIVDYIFPELKESEVERTRKEILDYIIKGSESLYDVQQYGKERFEKWIAWLEKQGGQKEYTFKSLPRLLDMIEPTSGAKVYCQKLIDTLVKEGYSTDAKIVGECLKKMNGEDVPMAIMDEKQGKNAYNKELSELLHKVICRFINDPDIPYSDREKVSMKVLPYVERLERQDRQKSFDYENANIQQKDFAPKVEPKFHEGDWVILTAGELSTTLQIVKVDTNKKLYWFNDSSYLPIVDEECLHFWTIQDANAGNVISWDDSKCIAIFKNIYDEDSFNSYGFVGGCTGTFESRMSYHDIEGAHPATKEQRDQLERAITNAGYRWNKEELKLEKI